MVQQSSLAARVTAIVPGARIRSITDAWNPRQRAPRVRVRSVELLLGAEEHHDRWLCELACGHALRLCEHELADFLPCQACFADQQLQEANQ